MRVGSRRFLAKASAFDVIVAIMLGSIMAGAITGSGELIPNLVAGLVLVILHAFLALVSFHTDWLGSIIKGQLILLIRTARVNLMGCAGRTLQLKTSPRRFGSRLITPILRK